MTDINWLQLWSDLVRINGDSDDKLRMQRYKEYVRKQRERPDPLLKFILERVSSNDRLVEIGPGNGRWTIALASKCKKVIAIEPSPDMRAALSEKLHSANIYNVAIIDATWQDADIEQHDICVGAHAMYNSPDLAGFVGKMEECAVRLCALAIRLPPADGVMAELSGLVRGCRYDSPNAVIAFNALYAMGINPNCLVEEGLVNWTSDSLDEAFKRAKRHLQVRDNSYDDTILAVLKKRLVFSGGKYIWPDGMRSALIYWKPVKSG